MKTLTMTVIFNISLFTSPNSTAVENTENLTNENQSKSHHQSSKRRGPPPFSKLDINNNGTITLEEFSQHKVPMGKHIDIFSSIDTNNDGVITEQEHSAHKPPKPKKHH